MRNIRLLIRKDFLSVCAVQGIFIFMLAVWAVTTFFVPHMLSMLTTMLVYILVLSLFQTEENELVCNVRAILPVEKKQPVIARYLYVYLILAVEAAAVCILCPISDIMLKRSSHWPTLLMLSTAISLVMVSVSMPILYRYGMSKARIIVVITYAVLVMVSSAFAPLLASTLNYISPSERFSTVATSASALAVCFVLSLISMRISIRMRR